VTETANLADMNNNNNSTAAHGSSSCAGQQLLRAAAAAGQGGSSSCWLIYQTISKSQIVIKGESVQKTKGESAKNEHNKISK